MPQLACRRCATARPSAPTPANGRSSPLPGASRTSALLRSQGNEAADALFARRQNIGGARLRAVAIRLQDIFARRRHGCRRVHRRERASQGRSGGSHPGGRCPRRRAGRPAPEKAVDRRHGRPGRAAQQSRSASGLQRARHGRSRHGGGEPATEPDDLHFPAGEPGRARNRAQDRCEHPCAGNPARSYGGGGGSLSPSAASCGGRNAARRGRRAARLLSSRRLPRADRLSHSGEVLG